MSSEADSTQEEPLPPSGSVRLLTLIEDVEWEGANGIAIASEADKEEKSMRVLAWLLHPLQPEHFIRELFGRPQPVLLSRSNREHFAGLFSRAEIDRQLEEGGLVWTDDVDAAKYVDGVRTTHNGEGAATLVDVMRRYDEGCSIRLSWPHRHCDALWSVLVQLEEVFGSAAGANAYYTPPSCQGFAPHYDDIDAFVLQVEGTKTWRLYTPRAVDDSMPQFSSHNLSAEELEASFEPCGEAVLRPGDLLYLPRGCVHQAVACPGDASLHVTASVGRMHTWRDLLEVGLQGALESASASHPEWRQNLPVDVADHLGIVHADDADDDADDGADGADASGRPGGVGGSAGGEGDIPDWVERDELLQTSSSAARRSAISLRLRSMLRQLVDELPLDAMVDQFVCQRFLFDRLPPFVGAQDAARRPSKPEAVTLDSRIRLLSRRAARLAVEEGVAALYYSTDNGRTYRSHAQPQHVDFALEAAPAIERVLTAYPKFVSVRKLPCDSDAQRLDIAQALAEVGVVLVRPPAKGAEA